MASTKAAPIEKPKKAAPKKPGAKKAAPKKAGAKKTAPKVAGAKKTAAGRFSEATFEFQA